MGFTDCAGGWGGGRLFLLGGATGEVVEAGVVLEVGGAVVEVGGSSVEVGGAAVEVGRASVEVGEPIRT